MRKRFEQQLVLGQKLIEETPVKLKSRDALSKLILSLKLIYSTPEYNEKIFSILEDRITKNKAKTGRRGMNLWQIFVLAQVRLCLNISYDWLHNLASFHTGIRQVMGIEFECGFMKVELEYQNIVDNVNLLDDATVRSLNDVIVEMGHGVFKKKEQAALRLKTDSFVVESNVHFPTDYNLLYDSGRKCLDVISKLIKNKEVKGWRKLKNWRSELKNLMRSLGQSTKGGGKDNAERVKKAAAQYLTKARLLTTKIDREKKELPLENEADLSLHLDLDKYIALLNKHIDLLDRRIIQGESIPQCEKLFSIFEQYTQWITKGKTNPSVELGKNLQITTDQYHLIVDYYVMENEVDKSTVIKLADRVRAKFPVFSWSFDKGFYTKENKELLGLFIPEVVMPKKGKLSQNEKAEENAPEFKRGRHRHSAVESNINELEHRGLDRCPERGYKHFKRYIGIGVCAYNLHKIGAELRRMALETQKQDVYMAA